MMDIIYSRGRIRLKKIHLIIFIVLLTLLLVLLFAKSIIYPVFNVACENKAKEIASQIAGQVAKDIMKDYEYDDIATVEKDNEDNVKYVEVKTDILNNIITNITENMQEQIDNDKDTKIGIKLGNFFGNTIFAGYGPEIYFKIESISNFQTALHTEFYSTGINQSLHRIYLNITCNVNIITPIKKVTQTSETKVLLVETIIIGTVPETFFDTGGLENIIMTEE